MSQEPQEPSSKSLTQQKKKKIFLLAFAGILLSLGYLTYRSYCFVSTDDAQVQAHTVMISAKVSGFITEVHVEQNQRVKAGEVLAVIDHRDYINKLNQIENERDSAAARVLDDDKNYQRLSTLFHKGAVSKQQFDHAEAMFREGSRRLKALQAQVDQARLNLEFTEIKAPSDGVIARKSAEPGMLASVGMPLFGFVSSKERWIEANFKETELKQMKVGDPVEISIDAISQKKFLGKVQSISPATGATFTLLPPDNATGNFTKVVQRVPVQIQITNLSTDEVEDLRVGFSADVSVRIR